MLSKEWNISDHVARYLDLYLARRAKNMKVQLRVRSLGLLCLYIRRTTQHLTQESRVQRMMAAKLRNRGIFVIFLIPLMEFTHYTCIEDPTARHWCVTKKDGSVLLREYCKESCLNYDCDADFQGFGSFITSPNFPKNYPNRKNCAYRIRLKEKQRIALKFLDFSLEGNGLSNW